MCNCTQLMGSLSLQTLCCKASPLFHVPKIALRIRRHTSLIQVLEVNRDCLAFSKANPYSPLHIFECCKGCANSIKVDTLMPTKFSDHSKQLLQCPQDVNQQKGDKCDYLWKNHQPLDSLILHPPPSKLLKCLYAYLRIPQSRITISDAQ